MSEDNVQIMQPTHGVIQSPNGEIQYYHSINNKYNPYLKNTSLHEQEDYEYRVITNNGERITILATDLTRAVHLECKASIIRLFCALDFITNLYFTLNTYYAAIFSSIIALISIMGYYSTITYDRNALIAYLIYQYLQTISRLTLLGFYIASIIIPKFQEQINKKHVLLEATGANLTIILFGTIGQIYITYFVQNFYNILPYRRVINDSSDISHRV